MELENFKHIIHRDDLKYLADKNNIRRITGIIQYNVRNPDGNENTYAKTLQEYLSNLTSFCRWINSNVYEIKKGFRLSSAELSRCISILSEDDDKRKKISGRIMKNSKRRFLGGLSLIGTGILLSFDPNREGETNITNEQIVNYFLDRTIGMRSREYEFNEEGRFAIAKRLYSMEKGEMIIIHRLLENPEKVIRKSESGWHILGRSAHGVRILMRKRMGKKRLYFLFKNNQSERGSYERHLRLEPKNTEFKPAA